MNLIKVLYGNGKAILVQAQKGPEVSMTLRPPDFWAIRT